MGNYTILYMFENPRRGRQARNFTTNSPKILDLKSSFEQIFSRKLPLGAPDFTFHFRVFMTYISLGTLCGDFIYVCVCHAAKLSFNV